MNNTYENSDHVMETIKNGIHVEFKLSTQTAETIEKSNVDKQNSKENLFWFTFSFSISILSYSISCFIRYKKTRRQSSWRKDCFKSR